MKIINHLFKPYSRRQRAQIVYHSIRKHFWHLFTSFLEKPDDEKCLYASYNYISPTSQVTTAIIFRLDKNWDSERETKKL